MTDRTNSNALPNEDNESSSSRQNANLAGTHEVTTKDFASHQLSPEDRARFEARLLAIKEEAAKKGIVTSPGVRLPGAPFPIADAQHGYYGVPVLKQPQWTWEIPIYFFVGGAAGAASVIGTAANWFGTDEDLVRDARFVAAGGAILSSGLLIADLGRPSRFLNMLRVFKPNSPMSIGAWVLAAFGTASGAAAFAELVRSKYDVGPVRILGNIAETFSCAAALPLATYTGVLIGSSVIPVWNHNIETLPVHFGMSGLNSGVSILELLGHDRSRALNLLGIGASAMETYEGFHLEFKREHEINRPLKEGFSGWITRLGGVLSGPLPLALRIAAAFAGSKNSRNMRRAAAASSIAGSLCTRIGWVKAGHVSAKDWRLPLELRESRSREKSEMQSIDEYPNTSARRLVPTSQAAVEDTEPST
jgi:hypothetical protein